MFRNCIVPNCKSSVKTSSMHKFPKNPCIGEQWIDAICSPVVINLPYHIIRKKRYSICSEHFEESAWVACFFRRRLRFDAIPTLGLPDIQSSKTIDFRRKNNLDQIDISINDENKEDETVITNIFTFDEFSSSFKYSDSPSFVDITKLPIRGRDMCENFKSESPMSTKCEKRLQLVSKHKISPDNSESIHRAQLNDIRKRKSCSDNLSRPHFDFIKKNNPDISKLQNVKSDISEIINRLESDHIQKGELNRSEKIVRPQLDSLVKSNQDISKRRKKPRLELQNGDSDIAEGPAIIQVERVQSNKVTAEKENATNVAAFEIVEYDRSVEENSSILRNIFFNEETNKERFVEGEENKEEQNQLFVGEVKHMEFANIGHQLYNTGKNVRRQKYRTTIRLKRQSTENGKVQEDVFLIEHTFNSTCNICPNHENDKVSCSVVKIE